MRSRFVTILTIGFVLSVLLTAAPAALAVEPNQPAVAIKVYNEHPSKNLIVSIQREGGMDWESSQHEGPWYIGPLAYNKDHQLLGQMGIFRANSEGSKGLHQMKIHVLNEQNTDIRVYEINCQLSQVGMKTLDVPGKCFLTSGVSDEGIRAKVDYERETNPMIFDPKNLEMMVIEVHVKIQTRD